MTVPGKGGRPRKWRSDADRVRAHRARQRGDAEPPTLDQALDDGDELAASIDREVALHEQLATARQVEHDLRAELTTTRRTLERELKRLDWLETTNATLTSDLALAHAELDHRRRHTPETVEQDLPRQQHAALRSANRAERRRAGRKR